MATACVRLVGKWVWQLYTCVRLVGKWVWQLYTCVKLDVLILCYDASTSFMIKPGGRRPRKEEAR